MKQSSTPEMAGMLKQLESTLNLYFAVKAPALPVGVKDFIVKAAPYFVILGIILAVPALLAILGLGAITAPLAMLSGDWGLLSLVSLAAMVVTLVLEALAVPGLFKKQKSAWDKLFLVSLVNLVPQILSMNLIGLVISSVVGWYFLFQVRSSYK